jgi:hypothetical protein
MTLISHMASSRSRLLFFVVVCDDTNSNTTDMSGQLGT